ncbi:hypothetical protein PCH70_38020 [Pseudomonas cichorii JBC1]|nr:hypothetical protein PCH70_38020 [Pseudomonas cichorii JBC1]
MRKVYTRGVDGTMRHTPSKIKDLRFDSANLRQQGPGGPAGENA